MRNYDFSNVGNNIAKIRTDKDMRVAQLSEKANIPLSTLYRIEQGGKIDIDYIGRIANALDVDVCDILGVDKLSENIDSFIALFDGLLFSNNYKSEKDGVVNPRKLIYCSDNGYLILNISQKLFTLFKELANITAEIEQINSEKSKKKIYKMRLEEAKSRYEKSKHNAVGSFFLISGKQMSDYIEKSVNDTQYFEELLADLQSETT